MAFATTRWSLIVQAGHDAPSALSDLIGIYWYPLYAFARRRGAGPEDAQDLVQGFFAALIEKQFLLAADPDRGRFRTFLLTAFKRHAAKEHEKATAKKRGGGRTKLSLDFEDGERRYAHEPVDDTLPERLYERRWAVVLLEKVLRDLEQDYGARDQALLFAELRPFLVAGTPTADRSDVAERLGLSNETLRVALHRLRKRYRALLEAAVLETLTDTGELEGEIRDLMAALA